MENSLRTSKWNSLKAGKLQGRKHGFASYKNHCMVLNRPGGAGTHGSMMRCAKQASLEPVLTTACLSRMTDKCHGHNTC